MFSQIAFFPILGKPLIMYGGAITLLCLLFTALIPTVLQKRWPAVFTYKTHVWLARITVFLGLAHGFLGVAIYFFR